MREENILVQKRRQWAKQIRRKELDVLFNKKRTQLLRGVNQLQSVNLNDQEKTQEIRHIIQTFGLEKQTAAIKKLVDMDHSLSLLYQVTGYLPQNMPNIVAGIISKVIHTPIQCIDNVNYDKLWQQSLWIDQHKPQLLDLYNIIKEWQKEDSSHLDDIIFLIHRLNDWNCCIQAQIVNFFSFISNVLSVGYWIEELIEPKKLDEHDHESKMLRLRESCASILLNILAGPDEKVVPYVPSILYSTGGSIKFRGLYYNLFLVNGVPNQLKLSMLINYTRLLSRNREVFMQDHAQLVTILMIGLEKLEKIQMQDENSFYQIGEVLVALLDELMTSLNLRYDNSIPRLQKTEDEERGLIFLQRVTTILRKLGSNRDLLRLIMEADALHQLFINHLRISSHSTELSISINILWILNDAVNDHMALSQFIKEPRYILRAIHSMRKYIETVKPSTSSAIYDFISEGMMLLSNCCAERQLFPVLIKQNIMVIISSLYPNIPKRKGGNQARNECAILLLNLLSVTQSYIIEGQQEQSQLLTYFFQPPISRVILLDLLDYRNSAKYIKKTLDTLQAYIIISEKHVQNQHLQALLRDLQLIDQLNQLARMNEVVQEQAENVIGLLKDTKFRTKSRRQEDDYI